MRGTRVTTAERLCHLLTYDQDTGLFTRRIAHGANGCHRAGEIAGSVHKETGYIMVSVDDYPYLAHRLAWLYMHGAWPQQQIDHINGDRTDNRWINLRSVTPAENQQNRRRPASNNKSGYLGVFWLTSRSCWTARIMVDGKNKALGHHKTPEAAAAAYIAAKRLLHPGNTL